MKVYIGPYVSAAHYAQLELFEDKGIPSREVRVDIDDYDMWNVDSTLGLIILPMLQQLHELKQGAPIVDDEDVPEHLRSTATPPTTDGDVDDNHFARWDWVMDEMIFAFESMYNDWEDQYYDGGTDSIFIINEEGKHELRPDYKAHADRIKNGFILFGKYYQGLWT